MKIKKVSHIVYIEILNSYDEDERINIISSLRKFLIKDNDDTKYFCI